MEHHYVTSTSSILLSVPPLSDYQFAMHRLPHFLVLLVVDDAMRLLDSLLCLSLFLSFNDDSRPHYVET